MKIKYPGIMGHSFGGYESAFIVTRSKLFAAAIASGAITDLNSFYFTVNQKSGKPDSWRFQNTQWNINKTPFEASEIYSTNSPINHVDKVMTPILLWSGKEDKQVDVKQSQEFYLALRRLNKKAIMLLYPNENHTISNEFSQKDLTIRILQWFDYFLKQERTEKHKWITNGIE